jgi:transcriptional regulator with XRE-family HTH domain
VKSPNLVDKHVGSRVRSRRIALGMSPEQLSVALGSTVSASAKMEAGIVRIGANQLLKLTKILGVNSVFFFAHEHQSVPPTFNGLRLTRALCIHQHQESRIREIVIKLVETLPK